MWSSTAYGEQSPTAAVVCETSEMSALDPGFVAEWPLHAAADGGRVDLIESLIVSGHDPNATDDDDWTPLYWVTTADAVRVLLRLGADPRHITPGGETVLMAVSRRGSPDTLDALVTVGDLDPNHHDGVGNTALMEAASAGRADNVRELINLGADPTARTRGGESALDAAVRESHLDVKAILEQHLGSPE